MSVQKNLKTKLYAGNKVHVVPDNEFMKKVMFLSGYSFLSDAPGCKFDTDFALEDGRMAFIRSFGFRLENTPSGVAVYAEFLGSVRNADVYNPRNVYGSCRIPNNIPILEELAKAIKEDFETRPQNVRLRGLLGEPPAVGTFNRFCAMYGLEIEDKERELEEKGDEAEEVLE